MIDTPPVEPARSRASFGKKLAAVLATAATIVGLVTGVLTIRDQLFDEPEAPPTVAPTQAAAQGGVTAAAVAQLTGDVQLSRFVALLGEPVSRERLQNGEWLMSTWTSLDAAVAAFSNGDDQVKAFTVTSLSPKFTPAVEHVAGAVRLRESVFADVQGVPDGVSGQYPPNARYSYLEFYEGTTASGGKSVVLAASYAANADDAAAGDISALGCLPVSIFDGELGCTPDQLDPVRRGMHVTSATIGDRTTLQALALEGAQFHPAS